MPRFARMGQDLDAFLFGNFERVERCLDDGFQVIDQIAAARAAIALVALEESP